MRGGSRHSWVIVLAGLLISAPAALASSILVAVTSSDDDLATESLVRTTAESKVHRLHWNVVAADVAARRGVVFERIPGCLDTGTACMKALVGPAGVERVLLFVVDRRRGVAGDSQWLVVGRLIDGTSGELVVSDQRLCDECTPEKLPPFVEDITTVLLANDPLAEETRAAAARADRAGARPYRIWKWVAIGAGLAAGGGGVALIAADQPAVRDGAQQPTERDTALPGYIGVGVGAALIATGIVLWIKDGKPAPAAADEPSAALVPTEGGLLFTVVGRY
jgi:hypothetical protein